MSWYRKLAAMPLEDPAQNQVGMQPSQLAPQQPVMNHPVEQEMPEEGEPLEQHEDRIFTISCVRDDGTEIESQEYSYDDMESKVEAYVEMMKDSTITSFTVGQV